MEDFVFKLVTAEGTGALFHLVLCACVCTYMQKEAEEGSSNINGSVLREDRFSGNRRSGMH